MQAKNCTWAVLFIALVASAEPATAQISPGVGTLQRAPVNSSYGTPPLTFEPNQGQIGPQAKFLARGPGYSVFLTTGGMVLSLRPASVVTPLTTAGTPSAKSNKRPPLITLQFKLLGANPSPEIVGEDQQLGRVNYFIGNDPARWHRNLPTYARVRYKNVYPGIDLLYYGNHQQLEYDFAIAPGSDPARIQFEITGSNGILINAEGELVLKAGGGELHFQNPTTYQESNGKRVPLQGGYIVKDATHIGFHVAQYDQRKPLVIDPVLVYSTYLGGSGNDQPKGLAVDGSGNVYIAGYTDSADFPLATLGSLPGGANHVFVAKLDPTGSNLVYADYIGGNSQDYGDALVLDNLNNVYVTGSTASSDFPVVNPYQGTYPGSFNAFLTKISADGSSLLYSTYLGGNGSDVPAGIARDTLGDVFVAGNTSSTNFPVANAYQSTALPNQGSLYGNYGFLTKFSPDGSSLIYSTYLSGNSNVPYNCGGTPCWSPPSSAINGIAVDASGNAYAAGITNTYNFPTTPGAYLTADSTQQNATVGFVSKFSGSGALDYSTYFYESSGLVTDINAIAVDSSGSAYVTGNAISDGTFPITSTSICDPAIYGWGCSYGFVTKFDPTASSLLYSTFLGPNNYANAAAIVLDATNDAYVLASTSSSSFGIVNGIEPYTLGSDLLLVEIDPTASSQLFATYLGGNGNENAAGMVLGSNGNLYVAGSTLSTDFPVTGKAFQKLLGGNTDTFVMKLGPASAPSVALSPSNLQYSTQQLGTTSQPQQVLLRNMGSSSLSIPAISVSPDFTETDNCGTSVPAAGSCTLSVSFAPTAAGSRAGSIQITDDAVGSPHAITLAGNGIGAVVGLSSTNLAFSSQQVGTSSTGKVVTVTNTGNATLNISTISITGDYSQTSGCAATLPPASNCIVTVTFTPAASGIRNGTLTIADDAYNSPQTVALTGVGANSSGPVAVLNPTSLAFASFQVGSSSTIKTVTLASVGNVPVSISSIRVTGDYSQSNNCPATLAPGSSCTVNVIFAPIVFGNRTGTLTVSDNAQGTQQTASLTGTGVDFSLTSSSKSATVKSGSSATYSLTITPTGGSFTNAVALTCSGSPALTTCSILPNAVTPNGKPTTATLTVTTTASLAQAAPARPFDIRMFYGLWIHLPGLGLVGMIFAGHKRRSKQWRLPVLLCLALVAMIVMSACAGGVGVVRQTQAGTTPGTYTITVSGAAGSLQHALPLTLTVQ
jgi:hypothetical protein